MAARMQRTQILLEPEQHRALTDLARAEGRSLSDIVREFIQAQLALRQHEHELRRQRQLAGLEQIRIHRQTILARRVEQPRLPDPADVINQLREARDADLIIPPSRD
jgi:hypothetical protein